MRKQGQKRSTKDEEKAERTRSYILSKKLRKKLLFSYSPRSINTPEVRKLFIMVNILQESCLLCRSQYTRGKKVVHCGQYTKRKLFTVSWSMHQKKVVHCGQQIYYKKSTP